MAKPAACKWCGLVALDPKDVKKWHRMEIRTVSVKGYMKLMSPEINIFYVCDICIDKIHNLFESKVIDAKIKT